MSSNPESSRVYKATQAKDQILSIIEENCNNELFFIKHRTRSYQVVFITSDTLVLVIDAPCNIQAKKIRLFWKNIYHQELEVVPERVQRISRGVYRYHVRAKRLLTPEYQRQELRYRTDDTNFRLGKIVVPMIAEDPLEIINNDSFAQLRQQFLEKIDTFDFYKMFLFESKGAPSEVVFSMVAESILYLKDISTYESYFRKNSVFFDKHPSLQKHLLNRLKALNLRYKSLLVLPIDYLTIIGSQFTIAYVVVAREKEEISSEDILSLDQAAHDFYSSLSESIRSTIRCQGKIENLSVVGARIFIYNDSLLEKFGKIANLSFVLSIVGLADINISGSVVYLEKGSNGVSIGVIFKKSPFGKRLQKFLYESIQNFELSID